jgi:diguanylate cyclase (GGDEF)-like protein
MALLSIPTILICVLVAIFAAALSTFIVWMNNRREIAAAYWFVSFTIGACGIFLLVAAMAGRNDFYVAASSFTVITSYGLMWSGFRAFNGASSMFLVGPLVGVAKVILMFAYPAIMHDVNLVIPWDTVPPALFAFASGYEILQNRQGERLQMRIPVSIFFITHGLVRLSPIYLASALPVRVIDGKTDSVWLKLFILESFLHVVLATFSCVLLVKDRAEFRYRCASEVDILTGIKNRRAFVAAVEKRLKNSDAEGHLAIIDLDHFKSINDNYGHMAGDVVLRAFSETVSTLCGKHVMFGRFGGEEFALFQTAVSGAAFAQKIEYLRAEVEAMRVHVNGLEIAITISVGTVSTADVSHSFDNLLSAADYALYAAKEDGRNRICRFSPAMRLHNVVENGLGNPNEIAEFRVTRALARSGASPLSRKS